MVMFTAFEIDRASLAPDQFIEVTYEELIADPVAVVGRIYDQLEMGSYDDVRERLTERVQSEKTTRRTS
jgi:omega-hydroxy-beta-dihydromenaquinone-9 sulfotransferase